jgi:hypothetical protein
MVGGTPEGVILRSMGGDMAEAIEDVTGYNLRAVTDPEPLILIGQLRRTAAKMWKDERNPKRRIVNDILDDLEKQERTRQFMTWQYRLHQDLSVMSLGLGNIDDAVDLDEVLAPKLDQFQDELEALEEMEAE